MTKLDLRLDYRQYLKGDDLCFYFYDYLSGGGYKHSTANNLIQNFKKPITKRNFPEWSYRNKAIDKFADIINESLGGFPCTIIPCPTSNPRNHKDFNDRLDLLCEKLGKLNANYNIEYCLDTITPYQSAHSDNGTRKPEDIAGLTIWTNGIKIQNDYIVLIDDVLTTGGHFRAYKDLTQINNQGNIVVGLFLARCVWE